MTGPNLAYAAAWYASQGVPVFPLRDGRKDPRTPQGFKDATTDAATVAAWWERWPSANIGAPAGVLFDVIDLDGPEAAAAVDALYPEGWPTTIAQTRTPRPGGRHLFIPVMGAPSKANLRPHLDTRGAGGYVVLPPSVTLAELDPDGTTKTHAGAYAWEGEPPTFGPPDVATLTACRPWRRVWDTPAPTVAPNLPRTPRMPSAGTTPYGARVLDAEAATVAATMVGGRNEALNRAAFKVGQLVPHEVNEGDARAALLDAARACGLPDSEAHTAIGSGLPNGMDNPRHPAERGRPAPLARLVERQVTTKLSPEPERIDPVTGEVLEDATEPQLDRKRSPAAVLADLAHARDWGDTNLRSHQRIAARFATYARGKVMFVHGAGWHRWDGTRWAPDANNAFTTRLLTELLTLSWSEAIADKDLQSDVRASMTAMGSRGVLELARSHEGLFAEHVDRDPWLLNCLNGTLDLHTMELRPHDPEDRITKVCGAAYRPEATADTWKYLVESSLPDADVRGFLQRWAGVALVGRVIEHVLVILTGEGRNGKGMIAHTIGKALGNADGYAITGAASMLVAGRYGDKPSAGELAAQYRLRGARWVVLSEIQRGARMDEATMKMLTGGDKIQAKRMGLDPVDFAPSHSLTMLANDLPVVDPDAKAVWDRLRVVPFTVDFSGREDKTLDERLESELEGVLAWCVAGLRDYLDRGRQLDEPDAVSARTDAYRDDNDALGRFIAEECVEHRAAHVSKADFAAAYAEWAEREREPKFGAKVMGARLNRRPGISEARTAGARSWQGIGLRSRDDGPDDPENLQTAVTTGNDSCDRSSQSISRESIVRNHREDLSQLSLTPATPVDKTVAEATPCRLHRDRPHPEACYTCAEMAGQGWGE